MGPVLRPGRCCDLRTRRRFTPTPPPVPNPKTAGADASARVWRGQRSLSGLAEVNSRRAGRGSTTAPDTHPAPMSVPAGVAHR